MMTFQSEFELTMAAVKADNLNRRQLALRATYAQKNAARWRRMGEHFNECAAGADLCARVHLFLLIDKN